MRHTDARALPGPHLAAYPLAVAQHTNQVKHIFGLTGVRRPWLEALEVSAGTASSRGAPCHLISGACHASRGGLDNLRQRRGTWRALARRCAHATRLATWRVPQSLNHPHPHPHPHPHNQPAHVCLRHAAAAPNTPFRIYSRSSTKHAGKTSCLASAPCP